MMGSWEGDKLRSEWEEGVEGIPIVSTAFRLHHAPTLSHAYGTGRIEGGLSSER